MTDPRWPVERVRQHEEGTTELVLDSRRQSPAEVAFALGSMTAHLEGGTCSHCGSVWFSKNPGPLCPVCNPAHPGYDREESESPARRARWLGIWRAELLSTILRLAEEHAHAKFPTLRLVSQDPSLDELLADFGEPPADFAAVGDFWALPEGAQALVQGEVPPALDPFRRRPDEAESNVVRFVHRNDQKRAFLSDTPHCLFSGCDFCALRSSQP